VFACTASLIIPNSYITEAGQTDPNGSAGQQGRSLQLIYRRCSKIASLAAAMLIPWIQDTRSMLASLNLGKTLPVGNADAGSYFNTQVLEAVDYGMSNVHPWFANQSITDAAAWTASFFQTTNADFAATLPNNPKMYIAETGWPTVCESLACHGPVLTIALSEHVAIQLQSQRRRVIGLRS
jgi:hypothetical protein